VDLREGVVEFPFRITVTSATGVASTADFGINSTILKNGFHQIINSAQLIINGQTIQSLQQYENVASSFRILSSWSQDNLVKWGPTCGFAIDDCTGNESIAKTGVDGLGINNALVSDVMSSASRGFDSTNNQGSIYNKGLVARAKMLNTQSAGSTVAGTILGTSGLTQSATSVVGNTAAGNTVGIRYAQYMMATVRLRDLFDINEFPMVKNIRGFMYLNFNATNVVLTPSGGTLSAVSINQQNGLSCPFVINDTATTPNTGLVYGATSTGQVTIAGTVSGQSVQLTSGITVSSPIMQSRLVCPFYVANPRVDAALTKHDHKFSTLDKIVNVISVTKSNSVNYTLTVGAPNPRRVVLLPMWVALAGSTFQPEVSPFDQTPATSGPYAWLRQLQVYVANKPLFQYPIDYDFEMWQSEIASNGLNGNVCDEMTSGLLTQQVWSENHRYYTIDLERRLDSEDGAAKSIQVSFTNPSTGYDLKVIAIVFYEKRWTIDTDLCRLSSIA
jgi:hypothetical protein